MRRAESLNCTLGREWTERSVAAWTKLMDQACKVILAAAALARDQERSGSDRDFLREFKKTL